MASARYSCNVQCSATDWRSRLEDRAKSVVALGKFDALHTGHRELVVQATQLGGKPWMVSFSGMAQVMGWPQRPPLVAMYDRPRVLRSWAAFCNGHVPEQRLVPFADVRNMSPEAFVHLLAEDFQVAGIVVGEGFRFGYKAAGDTAALQRLGTELGIAIKVVDLVQLAAAADNKPISSSTFR